MTYIITLRTKKSVLMASDTRANYFYDKIINGEKYQEVVAVADCIRKTFFIDKAKIGVQFMGIGYFPAADGEKYPLTYFIERLNNKKYSKSFERNAEVIFSFLKRISKRGDTTQYVKGVMAGFSKQNKSYACIFNTYNNSFEIKKLNVGQFIDSENNLSPFPDTELEAIKEIEKRIKEKAKEKYWHIGGPIEILKITPQNGEFIKENPKLFNGALKELVNCFKNDLKKINGRILQKPHLEKYSL